MRKSAPLYQILLCISAGLLLTSSVNADEGRYNRHKGQGKIVVANRASASLSVIDVRTDSISNTIDLPSANNPSQPMYVVHSAKADRIFVGDRGNNRVLVLDDEDFSIEASVPAGKGVFHMWADPADTQLWVNNDIDNTATVIDPVSLQTLATVAMPADLVALGGKPHDVILDPAGRSAYVTMVALPEKMTTWSNSVPSILPRPPVPGSARIPMSHSPGVTGYCTYPARTAMPCLS